MWSTYHMWYGAKAKPSGAAKVGHATSADGLSWSRDKASPVITTGSGWNSTGVHVPSVVVRGSFLQMWVTGTDSGSKPTIGYFAVAP